MHSDETNQNKKTQQTNLPAIIQKNNKRRKPFQECIPDSKFILLLQQKQKKVEDDKDSKQKTTLDQTQLFEMRLTFFIADIGVLKDLCENLHAKNIQNESFRNLNKIIEQNSKTLKFAKIILQNKYNLQFDKDKDYKDEFILTSLPEEIFKEINESSAYKIQYVQGLSSILKQLQEYKVTEDYQRIYDIAKDFFYLSNQIYNMMKYLSEQKSILEVNCIKVFAKQYFAKQFEIKEDQILNRQKLYGVQLGVILSLFQEGKFLTIYVKTHSFGKTIFNHSNIQAVQIEELLVYKILESFNFGPKVYFFYQDKYNFFIATEDVATKSDRKGERQQICQIFDEFFESDDDNNGDEELKQEYDNQVQIQLSVGLIYMDIICRILFLTDVILNTKNICFYFKNNIWNASIIDFRCIFSGSLVQESFGKNQSDCLIKGFTKYNYIGQANNLIKDTFEDEDFQDIRIQVAKSFDYQAFRTSILHAITQIDDFLQNNSDLKTSNKAQTRYDNYKASIIAVLAEFKKTVDEYKN